MPREPLSPDPDSLAEWRSLPQNPPSRRALAPAGGGTRITWMLVGGLVLVGAIALILQLLSQNG